MGLTHQSTGKKVLNQGLKIQTHSLDEIVIALAGNPNTGKSTVFNSLTGLNQHTGNWPGKTVSNARGRYKHGGKKFVLVDLPGTYSLIANSEEEEVARDFIYYGNHEATVIVVDATCLERNLIFVLQVLEMTDKVILCVNLLDEAERKGIKIDLAGLSQILGIPVVGTNARDGVGLDELKTVIGRLVHGEIPTNPIKVKYEKEIGGIDKDKIAETIVRLSEKIYNKTVKIENSKYDEWDRKIDDILTSKIFGIPIMIGLLGIIFWITIEGANYPSEALAAFFFHIETYVNTVFLNLQIPGWLHGILVFGVYRTLAWVISVMLPPMAIFFPLFTLLEDLGYLPRVAFNLDNFFKKACTHGKQALTMCMGFGCNAAGIIACRIIDSPRERLIAILTNNFVPCNGRFPILISMAIIFVGGTSAGLGKSMFASIIIIGVIVFGVAVTLFISKLLSRTILQGLPSTFTLELPPYRKPQVGKILLHSIFDRTLFVLGRAIIVAAPAGVIIWLMANIMVGEMSILHHSAAFLEPFASLLGMDGYIILGFILGFPANEIVIPIIVMGYMSTGTMLELNGMEALRILLLEKGWNWLTLVSVMIFTLMHFPCGTTLLTIKKETQSIKWTFLSFAIPTIAGIVVCFLLTQIVNLIGII